MLLLNFSHPLTDTHLADIRRLTDQEIDQILIIPTQFDHARGFEEQVHELLGSVPLTAQQWQTTPILINPPALAPITAVLLAEIHGMTGYFPTILRLRPVSGSTPPKFEVAELINLQAVRDSARGRR